MGSIVLLDLMGGVALLLWGLHMVLTGVLRAFGPHLRRVLGKALGNRFSAFCAGLGLTALLQSSTATGLMTTSLAAEGLVNLVPALALMLGANVGTTLIVQVLSFNITAVAPALFIVGLVTFRAGTQALTRALGRIAIGLGLTLLALHILVDTLAPAEEAPLVRSLLAAVTHDPVLCIVIAAALTWAAHSSAREATALQPDMAKMTAEFHMAFNVALAFNLTVETMLSQVMTAIMANDRKLAPSLAISNAARETLRIGDFAYQSQPHPDSAAVGGRGLESRQCC
jgi:phosphate:Na+ symporter